eukprot:4859315-Pleurochrysis_carterae.AAC.1
MQRLERSDRNCDDRYPRPPVRRAQLAHHLQLGEDTAVVQGRQHHPACEHERSTISAHAVRKPCMALVSSAVAAQQLKHFATTV